MGRGSRDSGVAGVRTTIRCGIFGALRHLHSRRRWHDAGVNVSGGTEVGGDDSGRGGCGVNFGVPTFFVAVDSHDDGAGGLGEGDREIEEAPFAPRARGPFERCCATMPKIAAAGAAATIITIITGGMLG